MRELIENLFRGKCIDETFLKGKWLEGQILHDGVTGKYYIHRDNCLNESDNVGEEGLLRFVAYEVDPETVCQYTEVDDKNGTNIFRKDIVSAPFIGYGGKKHTRIGVVEYVKGAFCVNWNDSEEYGKNFLGYVNDIEVIGNMFDNLELIGSD